MLKNETENSRVKSNGAEDIADAVAALKRGEIIVFPTETLYGLGVDALNGTAVDKLFHLKGRDSNNPIPVLVADEQMLLMLVAEISNSARKLMNRFWPGPLTLVLRARREIPARLLNANGGIGVRISSRPIATRLVQTLGRPLTATSANPSGRKPARTIEEAKRYFAGRISSFVNGGILTSKEGSTVAEVTEDSIRIIREGEIRASELESILSNEKPRR
jgi:L-threonylcarbamoyladenylate synthase